MPYDKTARLWPAVDEHFFREKTFTPQKQEGPHCVATTLAMATDSNPHDFYTTVNTQDPVSWSERLEAYGLCTPTNPASRAAIQGRRQKEFPSI